MTRSALPDEFAFLAHLGGEPSLEQAKVLTRTSLAVRPLRVWLGEERRRTARALLDGPYDRSDIGTVMGVSKQRVSDIACAQPREATLPEQFADLAHLAGEPTLEQAGALTRTSLAVGLLLAWLRDGRQRTVRALLDGPYDRSDIGTALDVSVQRVSDIAAGHLGPWARGQARKARQQT
ncbi:hypothetical protein [Streptomyces sp. NPDC052179]|uniref:hypothetical protein n=1 Tax=Streptomyces sp. NPDC052179 TaxID=3155680 RepID=UPI00341B7443